MPDEMAPRQTGLNGATGPPLLKRRIDLNFGGRYSAEKEKTASSYMRLRVRHGINDVSVGGSRYGRFRYGQRRHLCGLFRLE
ncbi:hypothetical protein SDC9_207696 [bioreactor metagenome]|uniref:Uncharacterized protein n=1 Tax=bioreactor metagenome TaxID=1076179 RepID=A0A645JK15_9ZZZZ